MAYSRDVHGTSDRMFKKVDFGFAPFIPFSRQFRLNIESRGAKKEGNFALEARQDPLGSTTITDDWQSDLDEATKALGITGNNPVDMLFDQMDKAVPKSDAKTKAASLARELAALLEGRSPLYPRYETMEKPELEEKIFMENLGIKRDINSWRGTAGVDPSWAVPDVDAHRVPMTKTMRSHGHEMVDSIAKSDDESAYLEYTLHRMAHSAGPILGEGKARELISRTEGTEATKMVNEKYTASIFAGIQNENDIGKRWEKTGKILVQRMMKEYNSISKKENDLFEIAMKKREDVFKGSKIKGIHTLDHTTIKTDTKEYMAKQMLDRFAEIQNRRIFGGKPDGGLPAYGWQEPLAISKLPQSTKDALADAGITFGKGKDKFSGGKTSTFVGFMLFTPHLKGKKYDSETGAMTSAKLSSISVESWTIDLAGEFERAGFSSRREMMKWMVDNFEAASNTAYGTMAQWMIVDQMINFGRDKQWASKQQKAIDAELQLWGNFSGQKGELLGSSLHGTAAKVAQGALTDGIQVEAVEVLSARNITKRLQKKFEKFFSGDKKADKDFMDFYEKATEAANDVTNVWKQGLSNQLRNTVWAKKLFAQTTSNIGHKAGMPWFMYAGSDTSSFHVRKDSRKGKEWILENMRRNVSQHEKMFGQTQTGAGLGPGGAAGANWVVDQQGISKSAGGSSWDASMGRTNVRGNVIVGHRQGRTSLDKMLDNLLKNK